MKNLSKKVLTALMILPLLNSCGKSGSGGGIAQNEEVHDEGSLDGSTIDGKYLALFDTLNPHVNGTIPGSLTLFRENDRLLVYLRLFAGKPKAWHPQAIYKGKRCPTLSDDRNGDGFIDIEEAMAVVGKAIIPLDTNLNSQTAGKNFYPVGDPSGYYHYERVASFSRMFDDLKDVDRDPDDHIDKLAPDEKFSFVGRVVMVQGVTEDTILPETVASIGRRRNFQTLPIACGIIKPNNTTPGSPEHGEIPGPIAEVDPDQDRPAPPDSDEGQTGGTVAGTTGTNDTNDGEVSDGETGRSTTGGTTSGGSTTGSSTTGGSTTGGTTGRSSGGFIGGFIGGSSGGRTGGTSGGGTSGGSTTGGTTGRSSGGFIGGFIGGSSGGSTTGSSTNGSTTGETGGSTTGGTTGE